MKFIKLHYYYSEIFVSMHSSGRVRCSSRGMILTHWLYRASKNALINTEILFQIQILTLLMNLSDEETFPIISTHCRRPRKRWQCVDAGTGQTT